MATASGVCHNDPNFAVICSFLDRYSEILALPAISYSELESWIEDTKRGFVLLVLNKCFLVLNNWIVFFCLKINQYIVEK